MTTQYGPIAGSETESSGIPVEIDERTWPVEMTRRGNPQATRIPTASEKISGFPTFHKSRRRPVLDPPRPRLSRRHPHPVVRSARSFLDARNGHRNPPLSDFPISGH